MPSAPVSQNPMTLSSPGLVKRAILQNLSNGPYQGRRLLRGANGDAQILPDRRIIKPPHQNPAVAQRPEPMFGGKLRRTRENEVGLAGQEPAAEGAQLAAEFLAGG